jgi:hypothetical protein
MSFLVRSKTEIAKAIANLFQMPADIDVCRCRCEGHYTIISAETEKPDQSLLTLKERLNLAIEQQKKLPSNDVDENKTKDLLVNI